MVFASLTFLLLFCPVFFLVYTLLKGKARSIFLLLASLFFYGWFKPYYILLILFEGILGWLAGLLLEKSRNRKAVLTGAIAIIVGLFIWFKYVPFLVESVNALLSVDLNIPAIVLPLGISFYSFQILSYLIDLYRGKVPAQKSLLFFLEYVCLFPQLIAGPIVRYQDIEGELKNPKENLEQMGKGIVRFIVGLSKKVLLANALYPIYADFSLDGQPSVLGFILAMFANLFYIYFDFSGYSDMAIGLGEMMGFTFPENFNYPFIAGSISEFWRRWHMSLTGWFRDYVYIPLGGNRVGTGRMIFNLLVVWLLTGIWHGAGWTYVVWGLAFWILIVLERFALKDFFEKHRIISRVWTVFFVLILFLLFSELTISDWFYDLGSIVNGSWPFINQTFQVNLLIHAVLFILAALGSTPLPKSGFIKLTGRYPSVMNILQILGCLGLLLACLASLVNGSYNPFLYFQF